MSLTRRSALSLLPLGALAACSNDPREGVYVEVAPASLRCDLDSSLDTRLTATGGRGPYVWEVLDGAPRGVVVTRDGKLTGRPRAVGPFSLSVRATDADGNTSSVVPIDLVVRRGTGPAPDVLVIGTSLSARIGTDRGDVKPWSDQWPLLTGFTATNWAWPGHNSSELAARFGATPLRTTSAVTLRNSSAAIDLDTRNIADQAPARLNGVAGTLSLRDPETRSSKNGSFRAATDTADRVIPNGAEVWRTVDAAPFQRHTLVLEMSRNDDPDDPSKTIANIRAVIKKFTTGQSKPRVIIVGQPLSTVARDKSPARLRSNDALKKAFPDEYADPWAYLRSDQCAKDIGLTWTAGDKARIRAGITPDSLRADILHLNTLGHRALAHFYQSEMQRRSWL